MVDRLASDAGWYLGLVRVDRLASDTGWYLGLVRLID